MACVMFTERGKIFYRFHLGKQQFERKAFDSDTKANRQIAEGKAAEWSKKINDGTFDIAIDFPRKKKTAVQRPRTVKAYYEKWIENREGRPSLIRDYKQHFRRYILPYLGNVLIQHVDKDLLEDFRTHLRRKCKLSMKTCRNVIDSSLRALVRDSGVQTDEFAKLKWDRQARKEPDPFDQNEVAKILSHYRKNRSFWEYAYCAFQAMQGTRPSESAALRWGSVDLKTGKATISRSRHMGTESAPKTAASDRHVDLQPAVIETLKQIKPLRETPDTYVFINGKGQPIDQSEFARGFQAVLRVLEIRQRVFYCLRHSFVSRALSAGWRLKYIAEQTGTSAIMIETRYGKYMPGEDKPKALYAARRKAG